MINPELESFEQPFIPFLGSSESLIANPQFPRYFTTPVKHTEMGDVNLSITPLVFPDFSKLRNTSIAFDGNHIEEIPELLAYRRGYGFITVLVNDCPTLPGQRVSVHILNAFSGQRVYSARLVDFSIIPTDGEKQPKFHSETFEDWFEELNNRTFSRIYVKPSNDTLRQMGFSMGAIITPER